MNKSIRQYFKIANISGDKFNRKELILLSNNRILYHVLSNSKTNKLNKIILDDAKQNMKALKDTLIFLKNSLGKDKIPYLIVKTYKFIEYITFDVDILVPFDRFHEAIQCLTKYGARIEPHPRQQGLHQRNCFKKGLLKMDLHRKFFWQGFEHIDLDFVWENTKKRKIAGITCLCPSSEADFLLHCKQLVYERYYITLLDFIAIKQAYSEGLNWIKIKHQVKKYNWSDSFNRLMKHINLLNYKLHNKPLFAKSKINPKTIKQFPFIYPIQDVLGVYKEMFLKQKKFPIFDFAYYFFAFGRFYLTNKNRYPYYLHWFKFDKKLNWSEAKSEKQVIN